MRLFIFFISATLALENSYAQTIAYKLNWSDQAISTVEGQSLSFENASYKGKNPEFKTKIDGYINGVKLKNEISEIVDENLVKHIDKSVANTEFEITVSHGIEAKKNVSIVSVNPLRLVNGKWEKLISFELEYTKGNTPQNKNKPYAWKNSSVFSIGTWFKLAFLSEGIHKIDYDYLKNELGLIPEDINPRTIKIYGNGGNILPQANSETWFDDVDQNAILISGENDGVFNNNDYILFYVKGSVKWTYDTTNNIFRHTPNHYSDTAFYFLTFGGVNGKRITDKANATGSGQLITDYMDYGLYEKDKINLLKNHAGVGSGRDWYSESFDFNTEQTFSFNTTGIKANSPVVVTTSLGSVSMANNPNFKIALNGNTIATTNFNPYFDTRYPTAHKKIEIWEPLPSSSNTQNVKLTYSKGSSSSSVGYLDFIEINYLKNLRLAGNQTFFRNPETLNQTLSTYQIEAISTDTKIWDITDIINITNQQFSISGTVATFTENSDVLREYVMFKGSGFPKPIAFRTIENQNLHELATPDFIIITHPLFRPEAERLAKHRTENDGLLVHVVDVEEIYNEFSSGSQDVSAIRNFMKMFYDRLNGNKLKYLLLFGDCSYDYKNIRTPNTNFVPVYESRNSENTITSHSSDDYFALLDDNEGFWCETCDNELLDIGVGRFPVKTLSEATGMVNKILAYNNRAVEEAHCNTQSFVSGKWRNEIVLIADDGDNNTHLNSAEKVFNTIKNHTDLNINKIYIDAFEQFSTAGGQSAPQVVEAINLRIKKGALLFNYSGHGGELGLAHEGIVSIPQINAWDNIQNMPLMFTATCEFGRYDDPFRTSGGEYTVLNPNGGAVSIVTTTRAVYSSQNDRINNAFYTKVFEPENPTTGEMPRLGDVIKVAKNNSTDKSVNNRNFALLGDPSLRLAYPRENITLTTINGKPINIANPDTISALSKVTMEGEIRYFNGSLISDFDGILEVAIYDKTSTIRTLGDENSPADFELRQNKIFEGRASVNKGKFKFSFIVPKDISYVYGEGKASFYAYSENLKTDANGSNLNFQVGGTASNINPDVEPPKIRLFMNDTSFVFGGTTGKSSLFIAKLFDENGINTTGVGIGHEISGVLNEDRSKVIVMNDFYTAELDDYQKGTVEFPFENLEVGNHRISLKAWDTYNNSNEEYLEFIVINKEDISIRHLLNYPNPFTTNTEFHFDHNRACDDLSVIIQVYTVSGKLVKTIVHELPHAPAHVSGIYWDGKDDFQDNIGRGVYVYKVRVKSNTDNAQIHEYQKMVILK